MPFKTAYSPKTIRAIQARRFRIPLSHRTKIMGILNLTPDSFSGDGLYTPGINFTVESILQKARAMVRQGADIIDVGGESTRPGSGRVSATREKHRVIPVIKTLTKNLNVPVSIDSYKPAVIHDALRAGASVVNLIMGTRLDPAIIKLVKQYKAALILMHIRGTPRTMQTHIHYDNLIEEIIGELRFSLEKCLESGIKSDRIIIDPGIGFGKTVGHNLEIINKLEKFKILGQPILVGPSRKSFIGKVLKRPVEQRLLGTAVAVSLAAANGANIIRVHDVSAAGEVLRLTDAVCNYRRWTKIK